MTALVLRFSSARITDIPNAIERISALTWLPVPVAGSDEPGKRLQVRSIITYARAPSSCLQVSLCFGDLGLRRSR